MWQKKVKEIAAEHNMEIHEINSMIHIIHPRPLSDDIKKTFSELIPNHTCNFIEGPKNATITNITFISLKYRIITEIQQDNRKIILKIVIPTENIEAFFEDASIILRADGYFDSWTMISYDNSFNKTGYYITRSSNKRNTIIQKDEITDLIITLKTTNSVEEFLKQL